ncbi:MAG TPA: hypothetical protein VJJ24_00075 [Candidatus Paceibacterota bacterium]
MDQNNERPKMVFEGEVQRPARSFQVPTSKMVGWVIKYSGGYIKDKNQANYVLIGIIVIAIAISLFLFFGGGETQVKVNPVRKF